MTESALDRGSPGEATRCRWCRRQLPDRKGPGRPREFCGGSCRQQDYLRRQRAADAGLAEHELVVTRTELDELHDRLYELEAVAWLLDAARPLLRNRFGSPSS